MHIPCIFLVSHYLDSFSWQAAAEKWRTDYMSASNRAARAEARRDAIVAWAEEQRDKSVLPSTKALWQSFIDKLDAAE